MTIAQAMQCVEQDQVTLQRALSNLETVKAFYAVGEGDTAVELYAQIRHRLAHSMRSIPVPNSKENQ